MKPNYINPVKSYVRLTLAAITVMLPLVSCQLNSGVKETPLLGQLAVGANNMVGESDKNETSSLFSPRNYRKLTYVPAGGGSQVPYVEAFASYENAQDINASRKFINDCAGRIDENYYLWLEDYITGRAAFSTGMSIFSQMLSTAGALFTPASTVRILSGTSGFVQGVNTTVEDKFFLSLQVLKQVPAMDTARKEAKIALNSHVNGGEFNIHTASGLLDDYFMAGTQFTAMANIEE